MRKNKIRILHVAQAAGGVDRYIRMLLKYLDKEKFENILVCSQDFHEEDYRDLVDSFEQVEMTRAIGGNDLKAIKEVRTLIKKYNPDIVYAHSSKAGAIARVADIGLKNHCVYNPHGWAFNMRCSAKKKAMYTIDVTKIESLITDKTTAIVPVHVYGSVCNVEEIEKIANKYGLKVLYDAAHAFGVQYKGRGITSYGDMSILSFHATKVYNTIEGGAICYNDEEYKTKLYRLRDFGIASEEVVDAIGANAKMNEFCAAMGLCNLKYVNQEIEKRKEVVNRYRENLNNVDGIKLLPVQKDVVANYSYFPIVINEKDFGATRNEVFEKLKDNNIFARKYFYPLTSQFDCYHGRYNNATPVALHISKRVLTLPLYADLCLKDVDTICRVITSCKK